jgi:ribosomal protein S17
MVMKIKLNRTVSVELNEPGKVLLNEKMLRRGDVISIKEIFPLSNTFDNLVLDTDEVLLEVNNGWYDVIEK